MLRTLLFPLTVCIALLTAGEARPDYAFVFVDPTTGMASSNFSVGVGQTTNIEVLLTQTGSTTGLSATGLNSGGVAVTGYNTGITNVTNVAGNSTLFPSSNITTQINSSSANVTEFLTSSSAGIMQNSILLGTFTFTGVTAGTTNTLTASAAPGYNVNVLADGTVIDNLISNSSANITVVAVPEPGTLILGGLLASGMCGTYLRRRVRLA